MRFIFRFIYYSVYAFSFLLTSTSFALPPGLNSGQKAVVHEPTDRSMGSPLQAADYRYAVEYDYKLADVTRERLRIMGEIDPSSMALTQPNLNRFLLFIYAVNPGIFQGLPAGHNGTIHGIVKGFVSAADHPNMMTRDDLVDLKAFIDALALFLGTRLQTEIAWAAKNYGVEINPVQPVSPTKLVQPSHSNGKDSKFQNTAEVVNVGAKECDDFLNVKNDFAWTFIPIILNSATKANFEIPNREEYLDSLKLSLYRLLETNSFAYFDEEAKRATCISYFNFDAPAFLTGGQNWVDSPSSTPLAYGAFLTKQVVLVASPKIF